MNFPHSPTGALPPRSTLEALVELVEAERVLLLPGSVFGHPVNVRFGFGRRDLPEALAGLRRFAASPA